MKTQPIIGFALLCVCFAPLACGPTPSGDGNTGGSGGSPDESGGSPNESGGTNAGGTASGGSPGESGGASSGGLGGASGGSESGGSGGGSGDPADTNYFEPDLDNTEQDPPNEGGIELVAFTLREGDLGAELLTAVENNGEYPLCAPSIRTYFFDSSGTEITNSYDPLQAPLHRGVNGTGSYLNCIGPGQIGMSENGSVDVVVADVAYMEHTFGGGLLADGVADLEITVTNVMVVESLGLSAFTGTLTNGSPDPVMNPGVDIFSVNSVGRPIGFGSAIDLVTIPAGGTWDFETLTFDHVGTDYVAFPGVSEPL